MRKIQFKGYGIELPKNTVELKGQVRYRISEGESQISLAVSACEKALKNANITINDIDCIVSASAVGIQPIPCTAALIHEKIAKGTSIPALDINTTCTSFITALDTMSYLVEAGRYERVLIVSCDVASIALNPKQKESFQLFSDGAAAFVIEKTEKEIGVIDAIQKTWSEGAHSTEIRGGLSNFHPKNYSEMTKEEYMFDMNGKTVLSLSISKIPELMKNFLKNNIFSENRIYSNDILINRIDEIFLRTLKVFIDNIMEISVKKESEKKVYDKEARYEFEKDKVKRDFIDIYLKGTNVDEELIDIICFELKCIENIKIKFDRIKYMIKDFLSTKSKNQIENENYLKKEIDNIENIVRDHMEGSLFSKNSSIKIECIRNPEKINTDPYIYFYLSNYGNSEDFSTYSKEKLEELIELFPNEKEANLFIKLYIEMNYSKNSENLRNILKEIVEIPKDKIFDNRYSYLLLNKVIDLSSYEYFRLSYSDFLTYMKFIIDPDTRKKIMIKFKEIKELYSYATDYNDLIKKGSEYKREIWGGDKYHINDVENFSKKFYMYFERNLKNYFSIEENQEIQKFIKDCEEEEETLNEYSSFINKKIYENKEMKKLINAANFILLNLYDKPFLFEKEYQNIKNEDNKEILEEKLKKIEDYQSKVRDFKEIIKYGKYEKEDLNIILNQLKQRVKKSEISKMKQGILISHEQENIFRLIRDLNEKRKKDKDEKIEMKIKILNKVVDYYSILKSI